MDSPRARSYGPSLRTVGGKAPAFKSGCQGQSAGNLPRFLRWLFRAEDMDVDIEGPDWEILTGIGSGAEKGLEAAGIDEFDQAVEVCAELQRSLGAPGAKYKLDDLICFLCLSQHAEAVSNPGMPALAHPVSIEEDLGLDPLPTRGLQTPPSLACDVPAPRDSAVQPLKARRWRRCSLLQPLALASLRPFVEALPAWRRTLPWLPIASAIFLFQCCRSLRVGALCIAGRIDDGKRLRVADSVACILSLQSKALVQAGVSRSTLLRTVACAWDWLEKCPPVFVDRSLLSLALLRMAIKFEVHRDHAGAALKLLGTLDEKPALLSLECRLVEALWAS